MKLKLGRDNPRQKETIGDIILAQENKVSNLQITLSFLVKLMWPR